jgi:membrane protease YdiL (CAAX protease family)
MDSPAYHAAPLPPTKAAPPPAALSVPAPAASTVPAPPATDDAAGRRLVRTAAAFYGITILFAFGYALFSGTITTLFGERAPTAGHVLAALAVGLGVVGLCRLGERTVPAVRRAWEALGRILGPLDWKAAITLAVISGVAEELLFRGALWPHLGLFGTSLLFGLVHVIPQRALWIYPLFATGCGFLLGLLRQGSENVAPPMIAHAVVNGINLVVLARRRPLASATAAPAAPTA